MGPRQSPGMISGGPDCVQWSASSWCSRTRMRAWKSAKAGYRSVASVASDHLIEIVYSLDDLSNRVSSLTTSSPRSKSQITFFRSRGCCRHASTNLRIRRDRRRPAANRRHALREPTYSATTAPGDRSSLSARLIGCGSGKQGRSERSKGASWETVEVTILRAGRGEVCNWEHSEERRARTVLRRAPTLTSRLRRRIRTSRTGTPESAA